jgi:hypothetical protein
MIKTEWTLWPPTNSVSVSALDGKLLEDEAGSMVDPWYQRLLPFPDWS